MDIINVERTTLTGRIASMILFWVANRLLFRHHRKRGFHGSHGSSSSMDHDSNDALLRAGDARHYLRSIGIAHSIPCLWKNWDVILDGVKRIRRSAAARDEQDERQRSTKKQKDATSPSSSTATTRLMKTNTVSIHPGGVSVPSTPIVIPEREELTKLQKVLVVLQRFDTWIQLVALTISGIFDVGSHDVVRVSIITSIVRQVCESVYHRKHVVVLEKERHLEEQRRIQQLQKTMWGRFQLLILKWIDETRSFFKWMLLITTATSSGFDQPSLVREDTSSSMTTSSSRSSTTSSTSLSSDTKPSTDENKRDHHQRRHHHHIQHAKRILTGQRESIFDDVVVGGIQIITVCVLANIDNNDNQQTSWMSWIVQKILRIILTSKWKTIGLSWIVFLLTLLENDVLFNQDLSSSQKLRKISWIAFVGLTSGKYVFSLGCDGGTSHR